MHSAVPRQPLVYTEVERIVLTDTADVVSKGFLEDLHRQPSNTDNFRERGRQQPRVYI